MPVYRLKHPYRRLPEYVTLASSAREAWAVVRCLADDPTFRERIDEMEIAEAPDVFALDEQPPGSELAYAAIHAGGGAYLHAVLIFRS